jgi:hypothetical protein
MTPCILIYINGPEQPSISVSSFLNFCTPKLEAAGSSKMLVIYQTTRHQTHKFGNLHSHRRENLQCLESSHFSAASKHRPINNLHQGCTNPGRQVARATKFPTVTPNICGSSVWDLLHGTLRAPRILKWALDF